MKKLLLILSLFLSCLCVPISAQTVHKVTLETALQLAKNKFSDQDYDYYQVQDNSTSVWTIFIDADPGANWEHDCYLYTVQKSYVFDHVGAAPKTTLTARRFPPIEEISILSRSSRSENVNTSFDTSKPRVVYSSSLAMTPDSIKNRTYALIISGGYNKENNYERYWNDCSYIYQVLTTRFKLPKDHIYPLMSDGSDPTPDMRPYPYRYGEFVSQGLDLDMDGNNEVILAATKANIRNTLSSLNAKMGKDDHLFIFVIDHGGSDGNNTSYICLWNEELLYDYELANYLRPFTQKLVNINAVLGQCNAGGFIDDLQKVGCVVAAACEGNRPSYASSDKCYDEFVYHWISAVNRANHKSKTIQSDFDKNKYVSMEEAFQYAVDNDTAWETPQYSSTPSSVGQDLAFNHMTKSVDLYIKDTEEDTGVEPDTQASLFWKSPSIWVRNQPDGGTAHENPEYTETHQTANIYVKVQNRGKEAYKGGKFLHIYWAQASTGLTAKAWKGREVFVNSEDGTQYATGNHLEAASIPAMAPGEEKIIRFTWALPRLLEAYPDGNFHFCLYAKIMDTTYDDGYEVGKESTYFTPKESNDQAQKNVTIIKSSGLGVGYNVYVRNIHTYASPYTLELVPQTTKDAAVFSHATVQMTMSPKLYDAWTRGGNQSKNVTVVSTPERRVRFNSSNSQLQGIKLNSSEFDILQLKFTFTPMMANGQTYTLDLIQKDEAGNIIGGETFEVTAPKLNLQPTFPINSTPGEDNEYELSVDDEEISTISWTNQRDEELGTAESVIVKGAYEPMTYSATAYYEDGTMATGSITIEASTGIESWQIANDRQKIFVKLFGNIPGNAYICLISLADGNNRPSEADHTSSNTRSIDISDLPSGNYAVTYIIDGVTIDQKKIQL